jgi:hypothetical protein
MDINRPDHQHDNNNISKPQPKSLLKNVSLEESYLPFGFDPYRSEFTMFFLTSIEAEGIYFTELAVVEFLKLYGRSY